MMLSIYDKEKFDADYEILYLDSNNPENRCLETCTTWPGLEKIENMAKSMKMDTVEIVTVYRSVDRYQVDLT